VSKIEKKLLHYTGKAIADYNMIQTGDRVVVCLSGGKDSYTLLCMLRMLRMRTNNKFELFAYTLDQSQPGWNDSGLRGWLEAHEVPYEIETRNTYGVVVDKTPEGKTYCSLCSRLRRGNIYRYAAEHGFNKVALGHHRDDLIQSLLMSILYSGEIRSMPPKLLTDNKRHIVIRPMAYCQERDIAAYAAEQAFPIIPCNLCGSQPNLQRQVIKDMLLQWERKFPGRLETMFRALQNVVPSHLADRSLFDFAALQSAARTGGAESESDEDALDDRAFPLELF
jgi:tRNA 2-thiocytidine biosynthesis protein TtcA